MATTPPRGALDFSTLSTQFRIIGTSPAWPEAQAAIARLRQPREPGAPYPEYASDVQCVRDFRALLVRSGGTIAAALLCGAAVGRNAPTERLGEKIVLGLSAVSEAHRFAEKNEVEIIALLEGLLREMSINNPAIPISGAFGPLYAGLAHLELWLSVLGNTLRGASRPMNDAERMNVEVSAWSSALDRLDQFFRGHPRPIPWLEELLAAPTGRGPQSIVRYDLLAMTITDWSAALTAPLLAEAPSWVALASLHALGFALNDSVPLESWAINSGFPASDVAVAVDHMAQWTRPPAPRAALIVRREKGSLVDGWRPSRAVAGLAFTARQLRALLEHWTAQSFDPPVFPPVELIAFEMPMDDPEVEQYLAYALRERLRIQRTIPIAYLYTRRPREKTEHPALTPKKLEDLFPDPPGTPSQAS